MIPAPATRAASYRAELAHPADFEGLRRILRTALALGIPPQLLDWTITGDESLPVRHPPLPPVPDAPTPRVPKQFLELAQLAISHTSPRRFRLLHSLLIRLQVQPRLLEDRSDPEVDDAEQMAKAVSRDRHKMRAFVRFRETSDEAGPHYIAWFEPSHHVLRLDAGFFVRRFASQRWTILTPQVSAHWNRQELEWLPGASRNDAPGEDPVEEIWKTYYASTFNPARLKVKAMESEMPRKYWKNLPEAALIPQLIAQAETRSSGMIAVGTLANVRDEAQACRRCPLWQPATQTVFGEGPEGARLMIVGEQPGDQEDLQGRPFVGPAGQLLDQALAEAGIDRSSAYVTNAVKHFKFQLRGKRRLHEAPNAGEIEACRWWLDRERALVKPGLVLMLGASAGRALMGRAVAVGKERGRPIPLPDGSAGFLTVHPSYLLRLPDEAAKQAEYARFVDDLRAAKAQAGA
ncbi:UdgX family uracil-DNA binding protein [Sandaracinobacteroides hominis]|uniref:UdgX family uracil-DNA binding protein n=1 Tax=Sandaracinobacteroides hominis TaxID=2780086 RepID=UPI002E28620A|nr:UdgX family uracil-DNA binding protein [Sandaracinobacteroides hominis]